MTLDPTYITKGEKVYAVLGDRVLASADDLDTLEEKVSALQQKTARTAAVDTISQSTHVETPNGLKGQIVGRSRDLWGEKVTVRFANGRIVSLDVTDKLRFSHEVPKNNKLAKLKDMLEKQTSEDMPSLIARRSEMVQAHKLARHLILQGATYSDEQKLADFAAQAELERLRVSSLIDEIKLAEAPPIEDREYGAVEQASLGGGDSGWLDDTIAQIENETEDLDLEQFMDEGPEAFASQIDADMVGDPIGVQSAALSHVRSKTAFVEEPYRAEYTKLWLARLEECRQKEAMFLEGKPIPKTASVQDDGFDEGLFL